MNTVEDIVERIPSSGRSLRRQQVYPQVPRDVDLSVVQNLESVLSGMDVSGAQVTQGVPARMNVGASGVRTRSSSRTGRLSMRKEGPGDKAQEQGKRKATLQSSLRQTLRLQMAIFQLF